MRFSACVHIVKRVGFFWGTSFLPYRTPLVGFKGSTGYRTFWRKTILVRSDGYLSRGYLTRSYFPIFRFRALGKFLLHLTPPHLPLAYLWALFLLRQLKLRSFRAFRYQIGLPSRGQRTHTNSSTVGRHTDPAVTLLTALFWRRRLWIARKIANPSSNRNKKTKNTGGKAKITKRKGPVIRSKDKKKSVWR